MLGAVPRGADVSVPSRHLGLVPAVEHGAPATRAVAAMGELVARSVDLAAFRRLARRFGRFGAPRRHGIPSPRSSAWPKGSWWPWPVGWRSRSGTPSTWSCCARPAPTSSSSIRRGTRHCRSGRPRWCCRGGFPEQHAGALAANPALRDDIARLARSGGIVQAECGGLLYLLDELCGEPMCGVLRGSADMADRLTLGYRDAVVATDSVVHRTGERRAGHEFHRTTVTRRRRHAGVVVAWPRRQAGARGCRARQRARVLPAHASGRRAGDRGPAGGRRRERVVTARLVGVGVGPGDPELLTLKGLRELETAGRVFVPVLSADECGRAEAVVRAQLGDRTVQRLVFALSDPVSGPQRRRRRHWDAAAGCVARYLAEYGGTAAFATIGDPNVYSTFGYLAATVRELRAGGRRSPPCRASRRCRPRPARPESRWWKATEPLTLLPVTRDVDRRGGGAGRGRGTVVAYKGGRRLRDAARGGRASRASERAVYAEHLGHAGRAACCHCPKWTPAAIGAPGAPYLSTVVVLPSRGARGEQL